MPARCPSRCPSRLPGAAELLRAIAGDPGQPAIARATALVSYSREGGHAKEALAYARALQALVPDNPAVDQLVGELGDGRQSGAAKAVAPH
jgi:hypothetical protein